MTSPGRRRPAAILVALAAAAPLSLAGVAPAPAAAEAAVHRTTSSSAAPLRVTIETLAPATIPERGRVTISGQITNVSTHAWTGLNVYLVVSRNPIRTRRELADAAKTEATAPVGGRVTGDGLYRTVGDLAPGASTPYRLSVRRGDLKVSGEPGVHWVGVHVLGADEDGRDSVADGRARTFMPLLPRAGTRAAARDRTRLALLVPLKAVVHRDSTGRLLDLERWSTVLAEDGRLSRLLTLSRRVSQRFTWVVDPALLDAVRSISVGNPSLDPPPDRGAQGLSSSPSSSASPAPSASAGPSSTGASPEEPAQTADASAWLRAFRRQAPLRSVVAVPYGDLDVSAALGAGAQALYDRARSLSVGTLARYGVPDAQPVVEPSSGYLSPEALAAVGTTTPVVLDDTALPTQTRPVLLREDGPPVVRSDTAAGSGGPAPNATYSALEMRQRIVSEAALHAMSTHRGQPLVVSVPKRWDPGLTTSSSRFFAGLDQPWLQMVDLPSVLAPARPGTDQASPEPSSAVRPSADVGGLVYPATDRAAQVPVGNLTASRELSASGHVYAGLVGHRSVSEAVDRVAMLASSTAVRSDPDTARALADSTTAHVRSQLGKVRVEGPSFSMMSGESGPIQVTLVNGLSQSVTVGLDTSTASNDLSFAEVTPVTLGPGRRTSIRLQATADDIGVHSVTLRTIDENGTPLGSQTQFNVRTSHVDTVIWVVMAAGATLLFVAIGIRLLRRIRRRRATHGPRLSRAAG